MPTDDRSFRPRNNQLTEIYTAFTAALNVKSLIARFRELALEFDQPTQDLCLQACKRLIARDLSAPNASKAVPIETSLDASLPAQSNKLAGESFGLLKTAFDFPLLTRCCR